MYVGDGGKSSTVPERYEEVEQDEEEKGMIKGEGEVEVEHYGRGWEKFMDILQDGMMEESTLGYLTGFLEI